MGKVGVVAGQLGGITQQQLAAAVAGLYDDRGNYDASGNVFPSSGGSGVGGSILQGDIWVISVGGTLGGEAVVPGDSVRALTDAPGQTAGNWAIVHSGTAEDATILAFSALTITPNSLTVGTGTDAFTQTQFAANTFPARASTGNLVAKAISDFGLSLVAAAGQAAAATVLGLVIGTNVQAYSSNLDAFAAKTAPAGVVVGTTDVQTLTNKTLTSPAINSPTGLVKADVGLGNVDNTSDANKPISTATQTALDAKVTGPATATDNAIVRFDSTTGKLVQNSVVTIADTTGAISGARSISLHGSTSGAIVLQVPAIAGSHVITFPAGTTDFSATGGAGQYLKQSSAGAALTVGTIDSADIPTGINANKIADGSISNTVFQYLGGVSSNIQTQIDGKFTNSVTNARLLGRYAGTNGAVQEVTIGSGLSLSGAGELSATASGLGGTVGATDNAVPRADGTGGSTLQGSVVTIADTTGIIAGTQGITFSGSTSGTTALVPTAVASGTLTLPAATGTIALTTIVSDDAYNESSWNGVTTIAPSKNAVRDKFESLAIPQTEYLTANVNNGGEEGPTETDVTDLTLNLVSGQKYRITGRFTSSAESITNGQLTFDAGTVTVTGMRGHAYIGDTTGTVALSTQSITSLADVITVSPGNNYIYETSIDFVIEVNAGGTLIPTFLGGQNSPAYGAILYKYSVLAAELIP